MLITFYLQWFVFFLPVDMNFDSPHITVPYFPLSEFSQGFWDANFTSPLILKQNRNIKERNTGREDMVASKGATSC